MKYVKQWFSHIILPISFLLITNSSFAEVLVLVHGFNSSGATWYKHGVVSTLQRSGWQNGGALVSHPVLGIYHRGPEKLLKHRVVTVDLPSEAPLELQAHVLQLYINYMSEQEPEQNFSLIAHSAGGVVARLLLVQQPNPKIHRLITIASPHLGSGMAEIGEIVAKSPMSIMGPIIGADDLDDAEILFNQLQREVPFTLLYWLNRQLHPDIEYISIVRNRGTFTNKDYFVRSYSQDMRNVPGIKRAITLPSYGEHELQYRDGFLITQIVNSPPDKSN